MSSNPDLVANESSLRSWAFGPGTVTCDVSDGSVVALEHPLHPSMSFLQGADERWHHRTAHWGKGFLITPQEAARWDQPCGIEIREDGIDCEYSLLKGVDLRVRRRFGERWSEEYILTNSRKRPVHVSSLAVSIPLRDVYHAAVDSLTRACHAHIWTGGACSWVWAQPMNGKAPALGLALTEGELWSYSIDSRNPWDSSHMRGHPYLHVTDAARAPHAMGGQPVIRLGAGRAYRWSWRLGWYGSFAEFEDHEVQTPFFWSGLSSQQGRPLRIEARHGARLKISGPVSVRKIAGGGAEIRSSISGVSHIDILAGKRRMRSAVLFFPPLRKIVERRIAYILRHQQASEREAGRRGAFLPVDCENRLHVVGAAWYDWSDARERIAMPLLLQHARRLGWGGRRLRVRIDEALAAFDHFAKTHLVLPDGAVNEDSFHKVPDRLYNYPWFAEFYFNRFVANGLDDDLDLAASILEAYYDRGGSKFLAFIDCMEQTLAALRERGQSRRADSLQERFIAHVDYFLGVGINLPKHEVNYEQTIVAPLLLILQAAHRLAPSQRFLDGIANVLPWLTAFGSEQPHVRMRHIPIRHWDGFWFGRWRMWGDVFPHYWSVLSAAVYANEARARRDPDGRHRQMAGEIFQANLSSFFEDGSATCAFMFPSCVNGSPAHAADPLANDQDFALVWYLKYPELWPR